MGEIRKRFQSKDIFFNNGIVNLYSFLKKNDFDCNVELNSSFCELCFDEDIEDELYFYILKEFFKEYKIVHQTKNDRWYFDEKRAEFILDKKWDVVGKSSGNDVLSGVYSYKSIDELGLSVEEIRDKFLSFCQKYNLKSYEKDISKIPNKKNEVITALTLDEAIANFTKYFVSSDKLNLDSKIHIFEDGQGSFHGMTRVPKSYKIDRWEALVYWFGTRVQRFYNYSYFIYPNSLDLNALLVFKRFLKISDESAKFRDKSGELKTIGTNIDFYTQLSKDGIENPNFYISKSEEEFEIKFFVYLYSIISHIEEQYERAKGRRVERKKEIYDTLEKMSFVVYTDDGTFKTSFSEYTKAYRLIEFFEILKKEGLFDYIADILVTFSMSQGGKEVNVNLQKYARKFLGFSNLRGEYYLCSFNILKNSSKPFGGKLFEFDRLYVKYIIGESDMNIYQQSKKLGDGIGHYCAELEDKDLLFKLRGIKNYKQLIAYFKDLKFSILKNDSKAKFSKEFNDTLSEVLEEIEPNWELVRDYIAIYAIDKYRAVTYAKSNRGER